MKRTSIFFVFFLTFLFSFSSFSQIAEDETAREAQLVREVTALHPSIVKVRPARVKEMSLPEFKIQWMPGITFKPGTSEVIQKTVARLVARYVVAFQGGVRTEGVEGGILAFLEGEGWYPRAAQVSYKVERREPLLVEVWVDFQKPNEQGTATCCDEGEKIGVIEGKIFKPL